MGQEDIEDLEAALAAEPDRARGLRIPPGSTQPYLLRYTWIARYADHVERYLEAFGRERVHVTLFDDFRRDTRLAYADVVLFVFREEYYLKMKEPRPGTQEYFDWQAKMAPVYGRAEVIIGKQRHGPTGTVQLAFQADVTRFSNLADEDKLPDRIGD